MKRSIVFSLLFCFTLLFLSFSGHADPQVPDDEDMARINYHSNLIFNGIRLYYQNYQQVPETLDVLITDGFVPSNLTNPFTGEFITGNAVDREDGGWVVDGDNIYLVNIITYLNGNEISVPMNPAMLNPPESFSDPDFMKVMILTAWGSAGLEAFDDAYGGLPWSIDQLRESDFWPFDNALNPYTDEPLLFESDLYGHMIWFFNEDSAGFRINLDPENMGLAVTAYSISGERIPLEEPDPEEVDQEESSD